MSEDKRKDNGRLIGSKNKEQGKLKEKNPIPNSSKENFRNDSTLSTKEFLKVRAGETKEQYADRTNKKKIKVYGRTKNNIIKSCKNGVLVIDKLPCKNKDKELKLRISVKYNERPFDFLKMYSFVLRWANVKYNVLKDDFELGYYFYEGRPFTKDEFEAVCFCLGAVRGVFSRFLNKGYITNISIITIDGVVKKTEFYQLSGSFNSLLKKIYSLISKTSPVYNGHNWKCAAKVNEELKLIIDGMNDEINEILSGEKSNEEIKIEN